jgi:hypothetical protein
MLSRSSGNLIKYGRNRELLDGQMGGGEGRRKNYRTAADSAQNSAGSLRKFVTFWKWQNACWSNGLGAT